MKKFQIGLLALWFMSCCPQYDVTTYTYANSVVKRIDRCSKTSFIIQDSNGKDYGEIWAEYSGINDGFDARIVFKDNKVSIMVIDGYFQSKNTDNEKFSFIYDTIYNHSNRLPGSYYIMLSRHYEQAYNDTTATQVKVQYMRDE